MSRRLRQAREPDGSSSEPSATAVQLINERAHILGLQLQQAALAARIAAAIKSHGQPTPEQQLQELLSRGVLAADLESARSEVAALNALLERVTSGRLASTSAPSGSTPAAAAHAGPHRAGSGRHTSQSGPGGAPAGAIGAAAGVASGASAGAITRAASSKQFSALAAEHVRHWLDQARESVAVLEDLAAPGGIEEWRPSLEGAEAGPLPRPPGGPPVAHFIARIPPELTALMILPPIAYEGIGGGGYGNGGGGAAAAGGGVLWSAAPLLPDPGAGVVYVVALHEAAEQLWPALAGGDLVLLLPGRYNWPEGSVVLRAAVRVLGLGRQPGDVVIHNNEEDDVFVECCAGPGPPPPPPLLLTAQQQQQQATQPQVQAGQQAAETGGGEGPGVVLENLTLLQLGGYEGALRVVRGRTTLVDVVVQFAMGGLQVDPGAHLVMRGCRVVGGATAGVTVAAGGMLELLAGCELSRCGGGDDVVPKDLGGVEVLVPLADCPRLAQPSARAVLQAHEDLLSPSRDLSGACPPPAADEAGGPVGGLPPWDSLPALLGTTQQPATVVVGPGCVIQEGFASPGVDWSSTRIRLMMEGNPARPGRRATKIEVAAAAAATSSALRGQQHGGADAATGLSGNGVGGGRSGAAATAAGGRRLGNGVVVGCRTLRQQLCAAVARAQRRQRGLDEDSGVRGEGRGGSSSSSSGSGGSSEGAEDDEDEGETGSSDTSGSAGDEWEEEQTNADSRRGRCGGCLAVWYCGEECQRKDWPRHAPECWALRGAELGAGARGAVT
ncbi:hypothetical protein GPECTOR_5g452 [Gonium pectorale]|uniref:MYND-type domain-containing protein n=1 Tax=Gonium pectorale TaxID=33097 RepID=A0A150GXA5_GONPE|nr:hypothetical protein GPECTOR_5g452 [Gonium pectorale]|eukprot:KXZ54373.1 hypothetical protein GPECTOR_5g452 [Gonium pectorale]